MREKLSLSCDITPACDTRDLVFDSSGEQPSADVQADINLQTVTKHATKQ